jgi:hypothetical protein
MQRDVVPCAGYKPSQQTLVAWFPEKKVRWTLACGTTLHALLNAINLLNLLNERVCGL